jgi:replicative DNA helicase
MQNDETVKKKRNEVDIAIEEILAVQNKDESLFLTGFDPLDRNLPEGSMNKMIFIGSRPGHGKTHNSETLIDNFLSGDINEGHDVRILRMNLEMPTKSLVLRALKKELRMSVREILSTPFKSLSEELQEKARNVLRKLKDKRVMNFSEAVEGDALESLISDFCTNLEEKVKKIVIVDHLHIYSDKTSIDSVLAICNKMKMKFRNLSFIFYFQFNRTLEDLWRDNKSNKVNLKNMFPHSGHIYQTDLLMQYADIVMGLVIPQAVDLEAFAEVNKKKYAHLASDFLPGKTNGLYATLRGNNRIYYNLIKVRGIDSFDDPRIFSAKLDVNKEEEIADDVLPLEETTPDLSFKPEEIQNFLDDVI